ncbi:MAG: BatD family protein [Bacteroidota bacterium]
MKRIAYIILIISLIAFTNVSWSQVNFRTIAPQEPIVTGESFEIQYVVEGEEKIETFTAPSFTGFRLVTGPHIYKGSVIDLNVAKPLINTVYTLAAIKPGKYFLPGARVLINGSPLSSNDVFIQVISKEDAFKLNKRKDGSFYKNSEYFLQPGEDPIEKIRRNLFMKVMVDKKTCYVGEPVVATYKLYSRLESRSDIVKNPGFYGFAVLDMVGLNDRYKTIETINGKTFDVHTVRRVQLYPLQAGQYTIDPMEISNKVEFSRSEVNKKTEQEIVEGLLNNSADNLRNNTEVYENSIKTEAFPVTVKPLPAKNKTDSFTAAVGNFSIKAELVKNEVRKNEQSSLVISLTGKGNFTQINAPEINWPAGIEGFEPVIKDSIDRLQVPLAGTKTFRYNFVSDKPGQYELGPIEFNFFNLDTNRFEKLVTKPLTIQVNYQENAKEKITEIQPATLKNLKWYWWAGGLIILCSLIAVLVFWYKKKNQTVVNEPAFSVDQPLTIDEILLAPQMMLVANERTFYSELNKSVWKYFNQKLKLSGSDMSKPVLVELLKRSGIEDKTVVDLISIMQQCETGMYTYAAIADDKQELFDTTRLLLKAIDEKM